MPNRKAQIAPNVFEFTFHKDDLEEGLRVIKSQCEGQTLIDTKEIGNRVKVTVIIYSNVPEGKGEEILQQLGASQVEVHGYQEGNAAQEVDF